MITVTAILSTSNQKCVAFMSHALKSSNSQYLAFAKVAELAGTYENVCLEDQLA